MPNPPKPTKLKMLQGNPGKRPLNENEPEPEPGIPPMPEWLKPFPVAVAEWERESQILDGMGIMTEAEQGLLAKRCFLESQIQAIALALPKNVEDRKYAQIKNLITEYRQLGSLLGLDQSSRSKMKTSKPKVKSKAEQFKARIKNGKK